MNTTLKRAVGPAVAAGLLVTALATPAAAQTPGSTVFRLFGSAYLSARTGVANQVTATVESGRLILTDTKGLAVGGGCIRLSPTSADCGSVTNTGRLSVGLGDGDDSFNGSTISLRSLVDAGLGKDNVSTGSGGDTVGVSDGVGNDTVDCGAGSDLVFRDAGDTIVNCEQRF
ncbi:hypothetical protein [Streptomyces sp. AS02]|uniref:hypothetical protein n=1 Tax=Streptomyces sp. AS02 TaxID=2938946 RepID=UPI00201FD544|nr:hypothetical protein [Streptomyces sp. AS02]MCL8016691.1 hypothetical protein [Streptomyces sp. AS02]